MNRVKTTGHPGACGTAAEGVTLCFGEMLWDLLPHGDFPGGAPFNVACHLHHLGVPVLAVSAVGKDGRGEALLERVRERGLSAAGIGRLEDIPTGTVKAELAANGDARYVIETAVAWDQIPLEAAVVNAAPSARALVFGSLALRSPANQRTFTRLAALVPTPAWRVFDVNLRAPFDDLDLVRRYAPLANVLKLNSAEAARLAGDPGNGEGAEETHARKLNADTGVPFVCVTAGARGAGLLRAGQWSWEPARAVKVVDTVGSGDAFLAQLLSGLLAGGRTDAELLAAACRRGEWVASQPGACPV